jgi:hypothetical protein
MSYGQGAGKDLHSIQDAKSKDRQTDTEEAVMRGNWKCHIRTEAAEAMGITRQLPPEDASRVIHSKNTSREAAIEAAVYELLPSGLPVGRHDRQSIEALIACEQDDSDWPTTH